MCISDINHILTSADWRTPHCSMPVRRMQLEMASPTSPPRMSPPSTRKLPTNQG